MIATKLGGKDTSLLSANGTQEIDTASAVTACKGHGCDKVIAAKASTSSNGQAPNSLG